MKQKVYSITLLLFLVLLISSSHISARFIVTKLKQEKVEPTQITRREDHESMSQQMGMEGCDTEDKECLERRTILEAHLDYVYTQHHKP